MRKLEIADADVMRIAIQQEIVRTEESRYDHRLHGLLLVTGGQSCQQVADLFGEDRRTVQRWVRTFESRGLDGLREGERPGRPKSIDARQWKVLEKDLRRNPNEFGLTTNHLWDGKLLVEHLRRRCDVTLGVRQCQRLFKQMGFRFRKPRPQVTQSDLGKVRAFKKTTSSGKTRRRWAMECGRMPLPATRYALPYVGTTRGQGSGDNPCINPQVYRLLRCGQSLQWQIHSFNVHQIRCAYLRAIPENIAAPSLAQQADDSDTRQRPLPTRQTAQATAEKASTAPRTTVSTTVQPPTGSGRVSLEAGAPIGYAQPVLCQPGGRTSCHLVLLGPVAKNQIQCCNDYAALLKTSCLVQDV